MSDITKDTSFDVEVEKLILNPEVKVGGNGSSYYCYVTINGQRTYAPGTYTLSEGDELKFSVFGSTKQYASTYYGYVYINGVKVLESTSGSIATYTWNIPPNTLFVNITMYYYDPDNANCIHGVIDVHYGTTKRSLSKFYLDSNPEREWTFEEGMSWLEFTASTYNTYQTIYNGYAGRDQTVHFVPYDFYVRLGEDTSWIALDGSYPLFEDVIEPNCHYTWIPMPY